MASVGKRGKERKSGPGVTLPALCVAETPGKMFPWTHDFVYIATGADSAVGVSIADLFGAFGGVCTAANTTIQSIFSAFKIHHIDLFPQTNAISAGPAQAGIEWGYALTPFVPDDFSSIIVPSGMSVPGFYRFKPPRGSLAGDWINGSGTLSDSTNVLILSNIAQGCVVRLRVSLRLDVVMSTTSTTVQNAVTTATLGNFYYLALDGASTNKLVPATGFPTTH